MYIWTTCCSHRMLERAYWSPIGIVVFVHAREPARKTSQSDTTPSETLRDSDNVILSNHSAFTLFKTFGSTRLPKTPKTRRPSLRNLSLQKLAVKPSASRLLPWAYLFRQSPLPQAEGHHHQPQQWIVDNIYK